MNIWLLRAISNGGEIGCNENNTLRVCFASWTFEQDLGQLASDIHFLTEQQFLEFLQLEEDFGLILWTYAVGLTINFTDYGFVDGNGGDEGHHRQGNQYGL